MTSDSQRIPVTIVTGFLGSGKTTLVNHILTAAHGRRIAVVENEFGEAGIDSELLVERAEETIVEMNNGCICCTVRGDLVRILARLAADRAAGRLDFERVVIETTGLADPAPVAQTFFLEPDVAGAYALDGIVTLVDAKHGQRSLDEHRVAQAQVGFADLMLLTKCDLATHAETLALAARLQAMNARAPVKLVDHGRIAIAEVLEIGGFALDAAADLERLHAHEHAPHGAAVASFVHREKRPYDLGKLEHFLGLVIDRYADDLLRYKGVLHVGGREERIIFQGVHALLGAEPGRRWRHDEERSSTLVFIGRGLPRAAIERGLACCVEGSADDPARALRAA